MKITGRIILLISLTLFSLILSAQSSITIKRDSYLETNAACPKTQYQYWVDTKANYGNYKWEITGGSFIHFGQSVKEIFLPNVSTVIVVWDNVMSIGGNAPKGTITVSVYNKDLSDEILDKGNRNQDIKSLKDLIPPSLSSSSTSTQLNFGEQEVKVHLDGAFNFPGIKKNGFPVPVTKY